MKFVCENCKAKYQIGDDKVAGKTLRMKCRKCGHMIQVSATVTESSVSQQIPGAGRAELHVDAPAPPGLHAPSLMDERSDDDGATIVRPSPLFMRATGANMPAVSAPRPAAGAPGAPPGARPAPPAPRPSAAARPSVPAPPRPSGLGAAPGAGGLAAGGLASGGLAGASARPTPSPPGARPYAPSGGTGPMQGLGGGFANALAKPVSTPPPAMTPQAPPAEDWYVGVGGVPLGPVRLSVIREKAAAGAVDGESLVWREGFDEWVPLKTLPGLLAIIDEVKAHPLLRPTPLPGAVTPVPRNGLVGLGAFTDKAQTPRPSQIPPAPTPNGSSAAFTEAKSANGGTNGGPAAEPFKPFVPLTPTPAAVAAATAQAPAPLGTLADPFAAPKASTAGAIAPGPPLNGGFTTEPKPAADLALGTPSVAPPASFAPAKKDRRVHPMAWAFIAMAAAFGGVAAWAIFLHKPEGPVVAAGTATPTGQSTGPLLGPAPPPPGTVPDGQVATGTPSPTGTVGVAGSPYSGTGPSPGNPKTPGTAKTSDPGSPIDRNGFGGTNTGPASTDPGNDSGKGQLTEGEISGVVNRNKPGISRRCWDPAFEASDGHVKSAKVTATVTIGPSGSVQSVSAGGGDAFPGLASCVAGSIRGWQFPASDGPTNTVIPFGFNRQ